MRTVTLRCTVLVLPFLLACTPSARQPGARVDACSPSYLKVARTAEELKTLTVSVSALLIGCRNDLDALTANERTLLHKSLQEAAAEEHFHIMAHESAEVRASLTAHLNESLGRPIITDIYLYEANIGDYVE